MDPHKISVSNETHHWWEFLVCSLLYTANRQTPSYVIHSTRRSDNFIDHKQIWVQCLVGLIKNSGFNVVLILRTCVFVHHLANWRSGAGGDLSWMMNAADTETRAHCSGGRGAPDTGHTGGWILPTPHQLLPLRRWAPACHWSVVTIPGLPLAVN